MSTHVHICKWNNLKQPQYGRLEVESSNETAFTHPATLNNTPTPNRSINKCQI